MPTPTPNTRIIAFSDTHGMHKKLSMPEESKDLDTTDVLVFAGDMCSFGNEEDVLYFANWMRKLPYSHKIIIAGNHDTPFESKGRHIQVNLFRGWSHYLENSSCVVNGLKFYGSPVTPSLGNWAFNVDKDSEEMQDKWESIPADTDVLVTHGPPYGVLDLNSAGTRCGCSILRSRVKKVNPKVHIFGHIHENHSYYSKRTTPEGPGRTLFFNVAICDNRYVPREKPQVIWLRDKE